MTQTVSLEKVLQVRENEKKAAQIAHHHSMELFEGIAIKLYTILKKKENAENCYEQYIKETTPIDIIREQMNYIELLNKQIIELQHQVSKARNKMDVKQEKLTTAHVEVKKFEKVIELRKTAQEKIVRKLEQTEMDAISTQQYVSQRLGE